MTALAQVLARPDVWRGNRLVQASLPALATGFAELDAQLPGGGWPRGALTELLVDGSGLGEISLLLPALFRLREEGGWTLLVAPPHPLHAPAWAAAGADLAKLLVASPADERDALWAMEQALTSGAPGAVLGWAPRLDGRAVRRLQVAAAASPAATFLFRPLAAAREPSAAPLRLALAASSHGRLAVDILKRRGMPSASTLHLAPPRPASWPHREARTPMAGHSPVHAAVCA